MDVEHNKSGHHIGRPTVDIPPRKLLSSAKSPSSASSPRRDNNKDEKDYCYDFDADDPYAGDHFRMYEFKIRRCTRSRSHDWTDCPFSHPGEKARRRDPRRYHYTGEVCPEFQHGGDCSRGDKCSFAHGVFECWLHPNRYRTEACKDGKNCQRKVCFFAHSPRQLRVLPPPPPPEDFICRGGGSPASVLSNKNSRCCLFCSHSPTSSLLGLSRSPSLSPPLSPADKAAALSRLSRRFSAANGNKEVLNDLISSLDSFSLTDSSSSPVTMPVSTAAMISNLSNHHHRLPLWLDVGERDLQLQHSSLQYALSPSTPCYLHGQIQQPPPSFFSDEFTPHGGRLSDFTATATAAAEARDKNSFGVGSIGDLDLGWVNDLLT